LLDVQQAVKASFDLNVVLVILEVWVTDIPVSILLDSRIGLALDCDLFSSLQIISCKGWRSQAARIADQFSLDIDEVFRFDFDNVLLWVFMWAICVWVFFQRF
jgi:hypothetical protein